MHMRFLILLLTFILIFKNNRKYTISPFLSFGIMSKQLIHINCFRIKSIILSILSIVLMCLHKCLPNSSFTTTRWTYYEHTMTHIEDVCTIYAFLYKLLFIIETHLVTSYFLANLCQLGRFLVFGFCVWEEILDQSNKNRLVVCYDLRNVKVTQCSHQKRIFLHFFIVRVTL